MKWCGKGFWKYPCIKYCRRSKTYKHHYAFTGDVRESRKLNKACSNRDSSVTQVSTCEISTHPCKKEETKLPIGYQYIKVSNANLYLHAHVGSRQGHPMTLWDTCNGASNCRWMFERSMHDATLFYIKISNQNLYLHAHGGSYEGAHTSLHPCDTWTDLPNCQWGFEEFEGGHYLRSHNTQLYLCAVQSKRGQRNILTNWQKAQSQPRCKWTLSNTFR